MIANTSASCKTVVKDEPKNKQIKTKTLLILLVVYEYIAGGLWEI